MPTDEAPDGAMGALAQALQTAAATRSRLAKVEAIAGALRVAAREGDEALRTAVRVAAGELGGGARAATGVGWRMLAGVVSAVTGATDAELFEAARRRGDLGDAVFDVTIARARDRPGVSLDDVAELARALGSGAARAVKADLLAGVLRRATPLQAKYLAKALLGEMRTGAAPGVIREAIARAFGASPEEARRASGLLPDLAELAVLASGGRLGEARLVPLRPLAFMLATPREAVREAVDLGAVVVEDKLDGVRAQVHVSGGHVAVFARGQGNVTQTFPEVARALGAWSEDAVMDGEIVAAGEDGRPRPFQALQARLGRKDPAHTLLAEVPIVFVAFDLLALGGEALIDRPLAERRAALERLAARHPDAGAFRLNAVYAVEDEAALDAAFASARARANEGLVLKRRDAPYEPGRRGHAWIKVKRALATLDVVVVAVEEGHGKRAGKLSDYTFAVWDDGALVTVGKAYSGLTDAEIDALGQVFVETTLQDRGRVRVVEPRVVLEIAFDGIQRSSRHPSGFALRFPRIARVRDDKTPAQADTLQTVRDLFAAQVSSGHREEPVVPPRRTQKKARAPDTQLSLFGEGPGCVAGELRSANEPPADAGAGD